MGLPKGSLNPVVYEPDSHTVLLRNHPRFGESSLATFNDATTEATKSILVAVAKTHKCESQEAASMCTECTSLSERLSLL